MAFLVEVQVDPPFVAHVDPAQVQKAVREVLVQEGRVGEGELTVVITGDERIQELNHRYRGVNVPTDVLAFGEAAEGFVEAPDVPLYLGDVVISYPRVQAQAEEQGHSPDRELVLLVIHGVLHLLGYDHTNPEERTIMWARQEAILAGAGY
jgi:probable rRNA maturation factor